MLFECVHKVLKTSMKENTQSDKHISSVYHMLCTNWQKRIIENIYSLQYVDINQIFYTIRGINVLLVGYESSELHEIDTIYIGLLEKILESLFLILKELLWSVMMNSSGNNL